MIGGTDFYKNFLRSNLKQDYTWVYQNVDDVLEDNIVKSCRGRKNSTEKMEMRHLNLCISTCSEVAENFHRNIIKTKFATSRKIKQMQKECHSVCEMQFSCDEDALCANGL